jgi:putative membrane protein
MSVVSQVFAGVAVLVHLLAFGWEVLVFQRPGVHSGIFKIPTEDVPAVRLWSFNVGFYNLFLASGPVVGLALLHSGDPDVGRALVLYACGFMAAAGVVLFASDRMALSRPRGAGVGGALSQFLPPLVVLVLR